MSADDFWDSLTAEHSTKLTPPHRGRSPDRSTAMGTGSIKSWHHRRRGVECQSSQPRLIRIEGVCGSGKTNIARRVAALIGGIHIECDQYANEYDEPPPYAN